MLVQSLLNYKSQFKNALCFNNKLIKTKHQTTVQSFYHLLTFSINNTGIKINEIQKKKKIRQYLRH